MKRWTWPIALLVALAAATPAMAAPIDLGPGRDPSVVVDPTGTAHIVFATAGGASYCRLPRNARACDMRSLLPVAGPETQPRIFRRASDGALIVLQNPSNFQPGLGVPGGLWISVSADGGATFAAPALIATGASGFDAVRLAADGQSFVMLDAGTGRFEVSRAPFAGPDPRVLNLDPANSALATLAVLPDGRMLAAAQRSDGVGWRLFAGGDPLDINAWAKSGSLRREGDPMLATGPRGTFLLDYRTLSDQLVGGGAPFGLRSFDGKRLRWRATRTAGADQQLYGALDFIQDASGRLHIGVSTTQAKATCLFYTRTAARSSQWFGRTTLLYRSLDTDREPRGVALSAALDGRGVAVWHDDRTATSSGNVSVIALHQAAGRYRPNLSNAFRRGWCERGGSSIRRR